MSKKRFLVFAVAGLALAGAGAYYFMGKKEADKAAGLAGVVEVTLGDLETVVTAQGTLEPKDYVDVGAQVSGLVKKLNVEIGDVVKQGDLIAEIDPDVYEAQVRANQAELKTLKAQKQEQEALLKQARQKLQRNQNLIKEKAISRELLEDSETAYQVAQAKVVSLGAQIERAQSNLEGNVTNLGYTKIYAPMDGTVVSQSVKEGQTINANQTAPVIVQVANLGTMTVKAQVAEADITKLTTGMEMYFTTLGSKSRRWKGEVRQILPSPETVNDVVLYNVLVDVNNDDGQLMTGMTTQMFFVLGRAEQVPLVPLSALLKRQPEKDTDTAQAYEVRVVTRSGTQSRTVMVSLSDRTQAAIVDGLAVGDKLLRNIPQGENAAGSQRMRGPRL